MRMDRRRVLVLRTMVGDSVWVVVYVLWGHSMHMGVFHGELTHCTCKYGVLNVQPNSVSML